jgi:predicted SAM-dependent methyltransferase
MNIDIGGQKKRRDMDGKWKICDISKGSDYPCDLNSEPLPFEKNSVDNIFCSHTLEHIEPERIPVVLSEMKRVLKKEGKVRIVVPDAAKAIKWYLKNWRKLAHGTSPTKPKYVPETRMGYLTAWFYTPGKGHRSGFDLELLTVYLNRAGFRNITPMGYNKCSKIFKGKDYSRYKDNSIFVEATK